MSLLLRADKNKLILFIIATVLMLLVLTYALFVSERSNQTAIENAKVHLTNKARDIRSITESNINEQFYDLKIISHTDEFKKYLEQRKMHDELDKSCLFKTIHETNMNDFLIVALLDTSGIPFHVHCSPDFDPDFVDKIHTFPEVKSAAKLQEPTIGKSFFNNNSELFVNLVYPVFNDKYYIGSIFTTYSITNFCQKFFSDTTYQNYSIEITDKEGHYLFNSQPGFPDLGFPEEDFLINQPALSRKEKEQNLLWINQMNDHKTSTATVSYLDNQNNADQVLLAHTPLNLGENKFMIAVYDDLDNVTESSYLQSKNFFLVFAAIIAIFLLLWFFGWSWLKRIVTIKKESRLMSRINQSESRYLNLFNSSPIPIVVLNPSGLITNGNKQFLIYTGLQELKNSFGKKVTEVIRFEEKEKFTALLRRVQSNKNTINEASMTLSFYHPGGQLRIAEFSLSEIVTSDGNQLMCIIKDLTEKKLAENLSLRFGQILNNANTEIYVLDGITFRFMHATEGALSNLGYNIEELRDFTPEDIASFSQNSFETLATPLLSRKKEQITFEVTQRRKSGTTYPAEVTLQMSHEEKPPVFIAIVRDLTRERQAAETLAIERSLSQQYLELAEVMFVAINSEGLITMINRKGLEILGYAAKELIGQSWINLFIPEEAKPVISNVLDGIMTGETDIIEDFESQIITKDGTYKLISWQHKPIKNDKGNITGVLSSGMDISEAKKQEYDLINSQRQYATLIGNLKGIVYRCANDESWTMEFISNGLLTLAGYHPDELTDNSKLAFHDIIHPDDRSFVRNTIVGQLKKGPSFQLEYRIIHKNGQLVWVTEFGQGLMEEGIYTHLEGFITDITKIKETDAKLLKLTTAIEQSASSVVITDTTGRIEYVNPHFTKITGYTGEEAIGKRVSILKSGKMSPAFYSELWSTISSGQTWNGQFYNIKKSGEFFWESAVIAPVTDHNGDISSYIAIKQDITDFKQSQEKLLISQEDLKQSEARYRSLIQNNQSIMLLFDPISGEIVEANKAACIFYGKTEEELKKTCIFDINTLPRENLELYVKKLLVGEQNYFVFKHKAANNKIKDVELYTGEIIHQGRRLVFSVIHDITEKLETQKELVTAKEKAIESDRLKSAFLANMSHEIRTPMNAILGFSQLLNESNITADEMNQYITIINKSSGQLLNLIDDILKISQIEAGIVTIQPEEVNLTKTLNEIYQFFSLTIKQKGIQFYLDLPANRVENIFVDASRFKQIQINLISNAIKFTHQGEVRFGYTVKDNLLEFHVKDTGIGIDPAHFKLIFDRFMQVPHQEKELYGGTGIGLSISQALVDKMGGKIWLESEVGKGTTFYFTIPYDANILENSAQQNQPAAHTVLKNQLENKKILVTDDDDRNLQLLSKFLTAEKALLYYAGNGLEAINILEKTLGIDIVLMDIKMPVMDGLTATRTIKIKYPDLPVIIQTAYAMDNEREAAIEAGGDAYISKPVNKNLLINTIVNALKKKNKGAL